MDEITTNRQFRSIFSENSKQIVLEAMSKTQRRLPITAVLISILTLTIMSRSVLAGKADQIAPWVGTSLTGNECKGMRLGIGPFDYLQRASYPGELEVVEENHFNEDVENLVAGQSGTIIGDLHYTLSSWPNHHRALNSALKYRLQHLEDWPDPKIPPVECYLQRAINFNPNDPKPYMMYGLLMHKIGKYEEALKAYQTATRLLPDDIITRYNMGLTLVELKKYDEAQKLAESVYAAGFPLPGLKKKLIAANHWKNASQGAGPAATPQANAAAKEARPTPTTHPEGETATPTAITQ